MSNGIAFWLAAAAMAGVALAFVLPGLLSRRAGADGARRAALNAGILRSQLADLDRELAQGLLGVEEHARAADDIRRRVLAESPRDDAPRAAPARWPAWLIAVGLPALAVAIYLGIGHPDALDAPELPALAAGGTPTRGAVEAFVARLEAHVAAEPRDARAWALLGRSQLALDRFDASAAAFERAVALSPKVAADPLVWCEYADAVGMAQGGVLAGKPRRLIERALAIKADHPRALEMAGSAEYEAANFAQALVFWERLLPQLPAGSEAHRELAAAIERARRRAGSG